MGVKEANSDRQKYNFKPSGIGDSWLIGTDVNSNLDNTSNYANAFPNGVSDCPPNLIIPSSLTDENGHTKKVEIIGQYAFFACACYQLCSPKGQTKKLTLTKQVKVIKYSGLGWMDDLEEFVIEEGSVLETIETYGLDEIGVLFTLDSEDNRITLTLPSTLSSVFDNGIAGCNLFNEIIYCGSHPLPNSSRLVVNKPMPSLKVSSEYPPDEDFFGLEPDRNSQTVVEDSCKGFTYDFRTEPLESESGVMIIGWGNSTDLWCPPWLKIPEVINGSTVVAIKDKAFENCDTDGPITLPSTLKWVGASAFANTSRVNAVVSAATELVVGDAAFRDCGKYAQHPINVSLSLNTRLNGSAFKGAKIGEVYIT